MRKLFFFGVFLLLSLLITWPLAFHLNSFIIDPHDGLLITWIMNWDIHQLSLGLSGLQNILNANIFYPHTYTLAFSDYHLVGALVSLPFVLIFREPLLAFNINFLLGFALTGFSTYLLVKHLTNRGPASFFAGVLLTFSTIHLNYMAHLQLFSLWPVILTILFLLRGKAKLFILFFILSVLNSPLNFYFLLFLAICLRKNFRLLIIAVGLSAIFLMPYYLVSRQFGYTRPITDAINFSLQFPDLINVSVYSRLSTFVVQQLGTPAYFGGVLLVMVALALWRFRKLIWWWAAGLSFILAFGPALHIFRDTVHIGPIPAIPLPYTILYYILPGFSGFRTPSRWIILTAFALVVTVAIHFSKKITWCWTILLSALIILEINFPFKYHQVPSVAQFSPEQVWLKENFIGVPIIQFPIYNWDDSGFGQETLREYYSTIHWHPMFNGFSGFSPRQWEERVKWLQKKFPDEESVGYLRNLGIKLVLVPAAWDVSSVKNELELVASFPQTNVYALNNRFNTK